MSPVPFVSLLLSKELIANIAMFFSGLMWSWMLLFPCWMLLFLTECRLSTIGRNWFSPRVCFGHCSVVKHRICPTDEAGHARKFAWQWQWSGSTFSILMRAHLDAPVAFHNAWYVISTLRECGTVSNSFAMPRLMDKTVVVQLSRECSSSYCPPWDVLSISSTMHARRT